MAKVLVIGLDGATFDVIQPLITQGKLPNLARIIQTGSWGHLQSAVPPITPTAWTSVFTGKNPGKHGIYNFEQLDRQTYKRQPVHVDQHREKTLWNLLDEAGKRSIVVDVPYTYPPRPLNGLMITGYGTPRTSETIFTHPQDLTTHLPPELHSEIRVALPTHRFDRSQALIDEWREVMDGRHRLLTHLIQKEPWDFFFTVFNITDNMGHIFWTYIDPNHPNYHKTEGVHFRAAFFDAYMQCDDILGELIELAGTDTTTLIMSDHGFGSIYTRQYIFQRLANGGFLRYQDNTKLSLKSTTIRTMMRAYNKMPFLREWMKGLRPQNKKTLGHALRRTGLMPDIQSVDYQASPVLPTNFGLQMWINSQDQFANAPINPAQKTSMLANLQAHLQADIEPQTGKPIIAATHLGQDLYHGEAAHMGPDLVVEFTNFFQPRAEKTHLNPKLEGGHTQQGIFLAQGTAVSPTQLTNLSLVDLAPTILHLLDEPIPPDMDGRVLTDMLTSQYRANHPIQQSSAAAVFAETGESKDFTDEEQAELETQLRQLGYL